MCISRLSAGMALVVAGLAASGCSALYGQTTTAGARPFPMHYETIDLVQLLDPHGAAAKENSKVWPKLDHGQQIDLAFFQYHKQMRGQGWDLQVASRDEIQERILGASNQLCHQYQQYMQNVNSSSNFALGFLTTASAAAAAVVTGGTSQILAGTAAAASGTRAEFNQDYFYAETVSTIFRGIEAARDREYRAIILRRRQAPLPAGVTESQPLPKYTDKQSMQVYPIEAAVKDAIQYHAKCSLVTGVEELGDSVHLAKNPGLDAVQETLFKVNAARQTVIQNAKNPTELALGSVAPGAAGGDGTLIGGNPIAAYGSLIESVESASSALTTRIERLSRWPQDDSKTSAAAAVAARTKAAKDQLQDTDCNQGLLAAAKAIDEARLEVTNATNSAAKAQAASHLNTRLIEAQAKIADLSLAVDTFNADIGKLGDTIDAANYKAALTGTEAAMDVTKIKEVTKEVNDAAPPRLACQKQT